MRALCGRQARRAGCSGLAATSAFVCLGAGLALAPVEGPIMHPRGAGADAFVRSASSGSGLVILLPGAQVWAAGVF